MVSLLDYETSLACLVAFTVRIPKKIQIFYTD